MKRSVRARHEVQAASALHPEPVAPDAQHEQQGLRGDDTVIPPTLLTQPHLPGLDDHAR
jgi:hypothetical protein